MSATKDNHLKCIHLTSETKVPAEIYGARASAVVKLMQSKLPIPNGWAFSCDMVHRFQRSDFPDEWLIGDVLDAGLLVSLRASPIQREWGGPETLLNIGMNWKTHRILGRVLGKTAVDALYFRFVQDFAIQVARLDPEDFEVLIDEATTKKGIDYRVALEKSLELFEFETDSPFPQCANDQMRQALRSMAVAWNGTSAQILRAARGAPADAGLGLIVQEMALGIGDGEFGAGIAQFTSPVTGEEMAFGRYLSQSQGRAALDDEKKAQFLAKDARGPSLEVLCPEAFSMLRQYADQLRVMYRDEMQLEFTVENGAVWLLDVVPANRSGRAAVSIVVRLQKTGLISKEDALLRIDPKKLNEILHPQIDAKATREEIAEGIGASPGAATGKIVFDAMAAVVAEARGEATILIRIETSPDDIRGMHSANGILTERGGINSHAAVVARTLGVPCVVGAENININLKERIVHLADGSLLHEGDVITIDGGSGHVLRGAPKLVEPQLGGAFETFMGWADKIRTLGVRGNTDTPADVRLAYAFGIDGIGLVRTEHMFFDPNRLMVMRELIFADTAAGRVDALNLLLPMQRDDFIEILGLMKDQPVCIRLLDPPLHEFLPTSRDQILELAEAMNLPASKVSERIADLKEFNPMLGTRGVRLGVTVPEIYEMQTRAIFEAVSDLFKTSGRIISPEIMIPLVSANKEVELVKSRIDAVASAVKIEQGHDLEYKLGVMVETPRAALRAGDIAKSCAFMSFGTNDLTQMTYGLSRDDAGRFMREYVWQEIFKEDPFMTLDTEAVGELLEIAAVRGRMAQPNLQLGLCGEHGGDPDSVRFCHEAGFDYVSCSPFRTPIARLAAAQAELNAPRS